MAKPGEWVEKNSPLARIHAADLAQAKAASVRLNSAFEISSRRTRTVPLISEIFS
jgi:thymidine phosphorylase